MTHDVFVTGGTGYIGRPLLAALQSRGHTVRALVRAGSERRLPPDVSFVVGDPLRASTFVNAVGPADTIVHLIGTPHPSPAKAEEFQRVDGPSALASLEAATVSGARHLVYVSVAQPAPVMRAYIAVREAVEAEIHATHKASGLSATIVRPWYVLGPGHRWPHLLRPAYALARTVPSLRDSAERLGLVTRAQMVGALVFAVENKPAGVTIFDVPAIRRVGDATRVRLS